MVPSTMTDRFPRNSVCAIEYPIAAYDILRSIADFGLFGQLSQFILDGDDALFDVPRNLHQDRLGGLLSHKSFKQRRELRERPVSRILARYLKFSPLFRRPARRTVQQLL